MTRPYLEDRALRSTGRACLVLALFVLVVSSAGAAESALDGYSDHGAFLAQVRELAKSKYVARVSLGETLGGREIVTLSIGAGKRDEKPAVLIVGGVEPVRPVDSEVALRLAERLVKKAETDASFRAVFDRVTFYVIPRPAPDGAEAFFKRPFRERSVNERPIDEDNDARIDEDGPEDLNGDGWITAMRVEDAAGDSIPHPGDDRVMIQADPKKGERGRYKLYIEGCDNDGDGKLNEDPPGGVAFNRNFPHNYPYFESGAGPHQVSEVETRAVADFAFDHPNIAVVWTLSAADNLLEKWKPDEAAEKKRIKTTLLASDAPYFDKFAEAYGKIRDRQGLPKPPKSAGALADWAYFQYGRWSLATRAWWIPTKAEEQSKKESPDSKDQGKDQGQGAKQSGEKDKELPKDERGAEDRSALAWFKARGVEGFVDWQPFNHPDLKDKKVEIGGFKPFLRQNPPAEEFDSLAEKHFQFLVEVAAMLPKVSIAEARTEPLGAGVWRVTAVVENEGVLPTESAMGRLARQAQNLQIELQLPNGIALVTGHARRTIGPLAGGGGQAEQAWLVHVEGGTTPQLEVHVWSPMVGSAAKRIILR